MRLRYAILLLLFSSLGCGGLTISRIGKIEVVSVVDDKEVNVSFETLSTLSDVQVERFRKAALWHPVEGFDLHGVRYRDMVACRFDGAITTRKLLLLLNIGFLNDNVREVRIKQNIRVGKWDEKEQCIKYVPLQKSDYEPQKSDHTKDPYRVDNGDILLVKDTAAVVGTSIFRKDRERWEKGQYVLDYPFEIQGDSGPEEFVVRYHFEIVPTLLGDID